MPKTLVDLTPLGLANHVGTWVNIPHNPQTHQQRKAGR